MEATVTTAEFRETPELVTEMRKLLKAPAMLIWLEALEETNPAKKPAPVGIQSHDAFIMLGEQTGWMSYRDLFRTGAVPKEPPPQEQEQSYAAPPDET